MSAHRKGFARRKAAAKWAGGLVAAGALAVAGPAGLAFAGPGTDTNNGGGFAPIATSCVPGAIGCATGGSLFGANFATPTPAALAAAVVRPQSCGAICNGANGDADNPNGQDGGWLFGNGGNGYTGAAGTAENPNGQDGGNGGTD